MNQERKLNSIISCVNKDLSQSLISNFDISVQHPMHHLKNLAEIQQLDILSATFADFMDKQDEIAHLRQDFFYPRMKDIPEG